MTNGTSPCPKAVLDILETVPDARAFIAAELRDMAAGRNEYGEMHFRHMPPWSRHIWLAAAEMILREIL